MLKHSKITHTTCISFWIPKRQAISTDNGFIFTKIQPKKLVRHGLLAGNSERACGILFLFSLLISFYFLEYETIVSRNDLSLGYSERDKSSVKSAGSRLQPRFFYDMNTHTQLCKTLSLQQVCSRPSLQQISLLPGPAESGALVTPCDSPNFLVL